jgi:ribA/ribD-fused uncharacterized protein
LTFEVAQYPSVEHAYQAARCASQADRDAIRAARSPGEAKRLGRAAAQTANWPDRREAVMHSLLHAKFREADLRRLLLATGCRPLVEENDWGDRFWGRVNGDGENRLGELLELVRSELASAAQDGFS